MSKIKLISSRKSVGSGYERQIETAESAIYGSAKLIIC